MTNLVFLDTETTSLRHDRRAWEIAVIVRREGQPDHEQSWLIDPDDLDLGNADPASLRIGRFYERHPWGIAADRMSGLHDEWHALTQVEALTRGAHIVGAVPSFDVEVLSNRMRANGICPSWHYHLIDVEALAVGWLAHRAIESPSVALRWSWLLPWKSDDLGLAVGVKPLPDDERHTALGDARWARDIYDAVIGRGKATGGDA